jgi:nicotinamide-nucleotide amidase
MNAEIIAVGSEMLTADKIDTNSLYITQQLNTIGIEVVQKSIIGDDRARLTEAIRDALRRSEVVILSGGLGPTEDDVTRDAVAAALGREQSFQQPVWEQVEARFRRMNRKPSENNRRQAFVLEGAEVLENPRGTAPGQWISADGRVVMLLPGPPRELKPLFDETCVPKLMAFFPPQSIRTMHIRVAGMGESEVDKLIAPVYTRYSNPVTTILAGPSDISVHLRARCAEASQGDALLNEVSQQIDAVLGDRIYTHEGHPMEEVIRQKLRAAGETVSTAESCTGGLISQRLTSVPNSSETFVGGVVPYTPELKTRILGIHPELLRIEGPVSESVARGMAVAVRRRLQSTYGLSITGFAGPDGGTDANPVGTVYIGVASSDSSDVKRYQFAGDRSRIRQLGAQLALDILRRAIR